MNRLTVLGKLENYAFMERIFESRGCANRDWPTFVLEADAALETLLTRYQSRVQARPGTTMPAPNRTSDEPVKDENQLVPVNKPKALEKTVKGDPSKGTPVQNPADKLPPHTMETLPEPPNEHSKQPNDEDKEKVIYNKNPPAKRPGQGTDPYPNTQLQSSFTHTHEALSFLREACKNLPDGLEAVEKVQAVMDEYVRKNIN